MAQLPSTVIAIESIETASQMESVKAECDQTPAGHKKDAALKHYTAAQSAFETHDHAECVRKIAAVRHALTWYPFTSE